MQRFMKFEDIIEYIDTYGVSDGLIIRKVATSDVLILHSFSMVGDLSKQQAFFTEKREIVQTIDPLSMWEIVNMDFEGDVK